MSKKTPQIRFKGFTDDWEERKLGEIFNYEQPTKYIVKSTEYDDTFNTPVLTAGKSFLLGYTDEITGIKNATVENPVVIFDDFTTGSHYVDFPFKIKSSAMKLLSLNDNSDNFYFMFNTLKNIKYVPQSHERHWISKFSEFEIYKPSQKEQQKIGSFFKQLDDTIALHQRKLELLKEQKKGFLQKMFPKNGARVPELRFEGFTDDWEERKLIDVKDNEDRYSYTGGPFGSDLKSSDYTEIGVRIIQLQNIGDGKFVNDYKIYTSEEKARSLNSNLIYPGEIIIAKMADPLARATILPKIEPKYLMASDGIRLKINTDYFDNYYILTLINSDVFRKEALNNSTGTTRKRIGLVTLGNLPMMIPSFEEQRKIGSFFKQLDDTITLHQRKLDLLKQQKKGFLQKMFVS